MQNSSKTEFHCTATMAKIANNIRSAALKDLAVDLLNRKVVRYDEAVSGNFNDFLKYAQNDAEYTFLLYPILKKELEEKGQWSLYNDIEKPFLLVNLECQRNGIRVNSDLIKLEISNLEAAKNSILDKLGDGSMNWSSHVQLQRKIYGEYDLPLVLDKGKVSTGKKALEKLSFDSRIALLQAYKKAESQQKQLKTLLKFVDPNTSRIHPYINTLGADTGRATSSCPNLQNIEKDSKVRNFFTASDGYDLIVMDFSQIEPRVLAHLIGDGKFKDLFYTEDDFYTSLQKKLFPATEDSKKARDITKTIVLGTLYGMTAKSTAEKLGIEIYQAVEFYRKFFNEFPEIDLFRESQNEIARKCGFAQGLLGRRRYIENLNSENKFDKFRAERQVLNAIVQGSAATLFKHKLVTLRKELSPEVRFLHHVHDEVIIEAPEAISSKILKQTKQILERPIDWFSIPLIAEGGIAKTWGAAKGGK